MKRLPGLTTDVESLDVGSGIFIFQNGPYDTLN